MSDELYYRRDWMSDDQWACAVMFADVVGGFHHICSEFKPAGTGVKVTVSASTFATFDFDRLTRLVVKAHDEMVRVEVLPVGSWVIGFVLHKRHKRDGRMHERHPTIEDAIRSVRS